MRSRASTVVVIAVTTLTALACSDDASSPSPDGGPDAGSMTADARVPGDGGCADCGEIDGGPTPAPCEALIARSVSASGDDGNVSENVLDGDLDTRWSANGVGQWIELELPEATSTSGVSIAWYRGDERQSSFSVELSEDGETYAEIFRGWSSGRSSEVESYGFGSTAEARFIRVTVYGNTQSDWASILELRAHTDHCEPWMQDIFLLIGQSNMAGRAPIEDVDRPALDGVYLLDGDGHWTPASNRPAGINRFSTVLKPSADQRLGPGYTFARALQAETGRTIGLVVNARGGTTLAQWMREDHEGDYALYDEAVERAQLALANNPGATLRGILWHQGEGNNNPRTSVDYVENIALIVEGLRADLAAPDAVFVAGEVGSWQGRGRYINPEIRRIPEVVARSGWVSSEGLTTHETNRDPWGPHFDSRSQRILGERYADEVYRLAYTP